MSTVTAGNELFPYQREGAAWLAKNKYALLADEMGLGKTAQAITALDMLDAKPVLVLCPAVARLNWIREFETFSKRPLRYLALMSKTDISMISSADVIVSSYDLAMSSAVLPALRRRRWGACVLDESHYLKNRRAKRTRAVLGHLAPMAGRVWALSGTPAPNNPSELWPLLRVFGATGLDYWGFTRRYCTLRETPFGTQITGGRNIDELRGVIAPVILRRKKEQVMKDLPPIRFDDVVVEASALGKDVLSTYFDNYLSWPPEKRWTVFHEDMAKQLRMVETVTQELGMGADSMKVLEGLESRVKSLRRYVGLQKVPKVLEMVRAELEAGAYPKIVLFAVHKDVLTELHEGLRDFGAVKLFGGTPALKRDKIVRKFQTDPKCRVFVGQVVAAGTAVTLTAAHNVMFVEADWTPANNQQAAMRCHRIGQDKPVFVRFAGMANSIDERIQRVLKQKTRTLTKLFDEQDAPKFVDPFAD